MRALVAAVALSGAASLMYQVSWTRRLVTVTSATVIAQSAVLAVFMAGLGLGAYLGGQWVRRMSRPLVGYAAVEVAAALIALSSTTVIVASDAIRAAVGTGGVWLQLTAVSAFMLVPTTLLGASLPMVIEHVERATGSDPVSRGRVVSLLYGVNTLGAAVGCVLAGFVTIEHLGLHMTVQCGAAMAIIAGCIAAVAGRAPTYGRDSVSTNAQSDRTLVAAAAVAGFIGLGAEVLWTRLLSLVIVNTVYCFTQVLIAVLVGIAIGSAIAGIAAKRAERDEDPRRVAVYVAGLLVLVSAILIALAPIGVREIASRPQLQTAIATGSSPIGLLALGVILVPPAAAVAAALPLLVMGSGAPHGSSAFGKLYAANTFGSVAGSIIVGLVLLPNLGAGSANIVLVASALALGASLVATARRVATSRLILVATTVTATMLAVSADVPRSIYARFLDPGVTIVALREGAHSDVMITDDTLGRRRIWINSTWVASTEADSALSVGAPHRVLGHLPALFVDNPRRAAGIALGTGQTFAAVLAHGFSQFDCVEINEGVIELSRRYFGKANDGFLDRPNVRIHNDDGRAFLRGTDERFDLIVLEPLQAWSAGTTNLYTREFYDEARAALAPAGVVAQWIPFYNQGADETRAMVKSAAEAFEGASLWLDRNDGILILTAERHAMPIATLLDRIEARGLRPRLRDNGVEDPADLLSLFLMGPASIAKWVEGADTIHDDRPFLEFAAAQQIGDDAFVPILQSLRRHQDPIDVMTTETSSATARATAIRLATIELSLLPHDAHARRIEVLERGLADARSSRRLQTAYRDTIIAFANTHPLAGQAAVYHRSLEHDPGFSEGLINLAIVYAKTGQSDLATKAAERARRVDRVRPRAEMLLRMLEAQSATSSTTRTTGAQ